MVVGRHIRRTGTNTSLLIQYISQRVALSVKCNYRKLMQDSGVARGGAGGAAAPHQPVPAACRKFVGKFVGKLNT